jgi:hypothetical protein
MVVNIITNSAAGRPYQQNLINVIAVSIPVLEGIRAVVFRQYLPVVMTVLHLVFCRKFYRRQTISLFFVAFFLKLIRIKTVNNVIAFSIFIFFVRASTDKNIFFR